MKKYHRPLLIWAVPSVFRRNWSKRIPQWLMLIVLVFSLPAGAHDQYTKIHVTVASGSFEEQLRRGQYDVIDNRITEGRFHLDRNISEEDIYLFTPSREEDLTTEQILQEMEEKGYKPANMTHALALGERIMKISPPVVYLGASWKNNFVILTWHVDPFHKGEFSRTGKVLKLFKITPTKRWPHGFELQYAAVRQNNTH
jgi:hypothetical protein